MFALECELVTWSRAEDDKSADMIMQQTDLCCVLFKLWHSNKQVMCVFTVLKGTVSMYMFFHIKSTLKPGILNMHAIISQSVFHHVLQLTIQILIIILCCCIYVYVDLLLLLLQCIAVRNRN